MTALGVGFTFAILASFVFSSVIRLTVGAPRDYQLGFVPVADLISKPDLYSVVVAVTAGIVGVVSILQARASALIGVFISVTTIPAAADMGVSAAFGHWEETLGATEQLLLNVVILLVVGVVALVLQRRFWESRAVASTERAGERADHSANVAPPSTTMAAPLRNFACSEQTNVATLPKSDGAPITPAPPSSRIRSVACGPGHKRFRVTPVPSSARSFAAVLAHAHSPARAVLDRARVGIGWTTE